MLISCWIVYSLLKNGSGSPTITAFSLICLIYKWARPIRLPFWDSPAFVETCNFRANPSIVHKQQAWVSPAKSTRKLRTNQSGINMEHTLRGRGRDSRTYVLLIIEKYTNNLSGTDGCWTLSRWNCSCFWWTGWSKPSLECLSYRSGDDGNSRRPMIRKTPSVTGRHKRPVRHQRTWLFSCCVSLFKNGWSK